MAFDILTTVGTCLGGALVAYVTSRLTLRREEAIATRTESKEGYERSLKLYTEVIALVEALVVGRGRAPDEFATIARSARPSLELTAPANVLDHFDATIEAVKAWGMHMVEVEPKRHDGLLIIQASNPTKEAHEKESARLYPLLMESFEAMKASMKADLELRRTPIRTSSVVRF